MVAAVFVLWFFLSVLGQAQATQRHRSRFQWVRRWDWFNLIPTWTFFAPRPAWTDYYLLYRDKLTDGRLTPWTEVILIQDRRWWHFLWNPAKHERKALVDMVRMLARHPALLLKQQRAAVEERRKLPSTAATMGKTLSIKSRLRRRFVPLPREIMCSMPYLLLLTVVSSQPRLAGASVATQFALLRTDAPLRFSAVAAEPAIALVSPFHEL